MFAISTFWSDFHPHITDQECGIATSECTYLKQNLGVANSQPEIILSWQTIQPGMIRCTSPISVWQDLGGELSCNTTKNQQMLLSTLSSSGQIIPWQPAAATVIIVFEFVCTQLCMFNEWQDSRFSIIQTKTIFAFVLLWYKLFCLIKKKNAVSWPYEKCGNTLRV